MGRHKKGNKVPHNVKERFRHQNLQRLLENVASHVPQPISLKKETKAKKLRRIVLYMKFLLHKKMQLSERASHVPKGSGISQMEENKEVVKERKKGPKKYSEEKSKSRHPQIVFLRKSLQTSNQAGFQATEIHKKASCTATSDSSDGHISLANESILNDSRQGHSSSNYYPTFKAKDHNCDVYPYWKHKTTAATFEHPSLNVSKRPWKGTTSNQTETTIFHPPKKNVPETGIFGKPFHHTENIADQNRIYDPESVFEDSNIDNHFLYGNSELNKERNVYETEAMEVFNKHALLSDSRKDKLPSMSTISHPTMFNPTLYFANETNVPKDVAFIQDGDNFPLEFFSSEESAPVTSSGEWFSSDEIDFIEKMSQESTNYNADIVDGEDSFDSCNVAKKSNCDIFNDPTETFCDMGQYINFNQGSTPMSFFTYGSTMDPNLKVPNYSSDYVRLVGNPNIAGYKNFQNVNHPELRDSFNLQPNNPVYYQVYPGSGICDDGVHSEAIVKQDSTTSLHESYYPDTQDEIVCHQNFPSKLVQTHPDKEFRCLKVKGKQVSNYFVPNDDCPPVDSQEENDFFGNSALNESMGCSSGQSEQESRDNFGHSIFKVGGECDVYAEMKIKQEEPEPSLLSEEISYSLNNLDTWYGNCFNIQQAQ